MKSIKIALFASGTGSNVYNIIQHFKSNASVEVVAVLSNKPSAGALNHAKNADIPTLVFNREEFYQSNKVENYLKEKETDYVILAGFLWKIPESLVNQFEGKMLNVHPALLKEMPQFGGKGMYGMNVHNAVIASGQTMSGITIHQVNEKYDDGAIVESFKCDITAEDTAESLAQKIHGLEKTHFPTTIEQFIKG